MPLSLKNLLQVQYLSLGIDEVLDLPVHALKGVTATDATHLDDAFGIKTIRDMGRNRFFHSAYQILRSENDQSFDPGPPLEWEAIFASAPISHYENHPAARFRIDFGPVFYRGRLDGTARVLVVGQDPSTDEILGQRAFVGSSGQRLQRYLNKIGIHRSYIIVNTFIYSIYGQFDNTMEQISLEPAIRDYRNEILDTIVAENPIEAIITFGRAPAHAITNWANTQNLPVFNLVHPAADVATAFPSWNAQLQPLTNAVSPDDPNLVDLTPYQGSWRRAAHKADIPRFDLPFGIPVWHGTNGTRSKRDPADRQKQIVWKAI
ncbi:uracil-DNA glycosylase family protein [Flavilitoribacter nigricans]|uniref:Uracil-DNA glycosylase n=1 Tax=Flavilitoribacter nigricans (strain ATCC 23147 / DSM 23189 / NBRC 102662 / NCIMB 1420 / SS-2) TaxID=1122177 RepID=A0A2D0MWS4_FLAN2|nr:uracil-DNA glycosylase family protein [Flavilitoribacter nigricans]PHN00732.1 uracil-DNA glycosylase [Flavilitoribacter nigricans DSM 23189 = NBRC 102662]